jgi:hypothetical protein
MAKNTTLESLAALGEYGINWSMSIERDPDHPNYGKYVVDVDGPTITVDTGPRFVVPNASFASPDADEALSKAAAYAADALLAAWERALSSVAAKVKALRALRPAGNGGPA